MNNFSCFAIHQADSWTDSYAAEHEMNSTNDNTTLQKHQNVETQMLRNQDVQTHLMGGE
jgi:hypothetical protein